MVRAWPKLRAAQQQITGVRLAWSELRTTQQEAPEEQEDGKIQQEAPEELDVEDEADDQPYVICRLVQF
jgi:hypothetical protein